ncbi:MAG TPA: zf-HC2 domain-containing protein [Herpetosiphonaceae bacterium]|nr:zf-HC2 domain-containing protein [Herpetosiphonaceae bacterium]
MNILSRHIPFGGLVDLAEGRLSPDEQARVRAHLATCTRCTAELSRLEQLIDLMRTDDAVGAPPHAIAQAVALIGARRRPERGATARRVLAALRFDSIQPTAGYAVRAEPAAERQLVFAAAAHDIDVHVAPAGAGWAVAGQLLGPPANGQVELRGATGVVSARLNNHMEFQLPAVPSGTYAMTVLLEDVEIAIDDLNVGS